MSGVIRSVPSTPRLWTCEPSLVTSMLPPTPSEPADSEMANSLSDASIGTTAPSSGSVVIVAAQRQADGDDAGDRREDGDAEDHERPRVPTDAVVLQLLLEGLEPVSGVVALFGVLIVHRAGHFANTRTDGRCRPEDQGPDRSPDDRTHFGPLRRDVGDRFGLRQRVVQGLGIQQPWVPVQIRSGSCTRATGPAARSVASNTRHSERSSLTSVVNVTT